MERTIVLYLRYVTVAVLLFVAVMGVARCGRDKSDPYNYYVPGVEMGVK